MRRSAIRIICLGGCMAAVASIAGAGSGSAVIRTQKLEYTGIPVGSNAGRLSIRTQRLEFTGTANSGAAR